MATESNFIRLRRERRLAAIQPGDLTGLEDYAAYLEAIIHGDYSIFEDEDKGTCLINKKALVTTIDGLSIHIYPGEHQPPHFHITTGEINASFSIGNFERIAGDLERQDLAKVKFWYELQGTRQILQEKWDSMRPTNCPVARHVAVAEQAPPPQAEIQGDRIVLRSHPELISHIQGAFPDVDEWWIEADRRVPDLRKPSKELVAIAIGPGPTRPAEDGPEVAIYVVNGVWEGFLYSYYATQTSARLAR